MRPNTRTDYVDLVALQVERRKRMADAERALAAHEAEVAARQMSLAFWWVVFGFLSTACGIIFAIEKGWW